MKKNRPQLLERLDMLRGAAALYVAMTHSIIWNFTSKNSILGILFSFGEEAVILFFLLSGFVIYFSVAKEKDITFKKYFIKRLNRIYPLLLVSFILSYVFFSLQTRHFSALNLKEFVGNVLMLQGNSYMNPGAWLNTFYGNAPLWSLAFEWYFYMLFYPINKYIKPNSANKVVLGISLFGCITFFLHPNQISAVLLYFLIWWVGVELAKAYTGFNYIHFKTVSFSIYSLILLVFFLILPVIKFKGRIGSFGDYPFIELRHFASALILILIGFGWAKLKFVGFDRIFGIFKIITPISYGIYIFHYSIFNSHFFLEEITCQPFRLFLMLLFLLLFSYVFEMHFQKIVTNFVFKRKKIILAAIN